MENNTYIIDLLVIFCILIPGAYCAVIDFTLGVRRKLEVRWLLINIALFNFAIAIILWGIYWGLDWRYSYFEFIDNPTEFKRSNLKDEIVISAGLSTLR